MITRVAIKNYKCFKDFEYRPGQFQLLAGRNGSGKTTFFEVLELLRRVIVGGESVNNLFNPRTVRRHPEAGTDQIFEVDIEAGGKLWAYRLVVEQGPVGAMIREESLSLNSDPLFETLDRVSKLSGTYSSTGQDLYRSPIRRWAELAEVGDDRGTYTRFLEFYAVWKNLLVVHLNPWVVSSTIHFTALHPAPDMADFAAWYHSLSSKKPRTVPDYFLSVEEIIPEFKRVRIDGPFVNDTMVFVAEFENSAGAVSDFLLEELSHGQIAVIVLHAILSFCVEQGAVICLDEPDNFLALREIQPYILQLQDESLDADCQVFVSSHHPEIYNIIMEDQITLFTESEADGVKVAPQVRPPDLEGLSLSEIFARGWEEE